MRIIKTYTYEEMSSKAADIIASQIKSKPDSVLGLATGSTPKCLYEKLINKYVEGELDFSQVRTVNLDEYKGLDKDNEQSYYYYMVNKFFNHINIQEGNYHLLNGMAEDSDEECKRYNEIIRSLGQIDLQLLGVGLNGHIGFNEPNDYFSKEIYLDALKEKTIKSNSRFFKDPEDVPRFAYTLAIKDIMQAKKILLIANGKNKAEIMREAICGKITPQVPVSILQLHQDVTIVADCEALSLI